MAKGYQKYMERKRKIAGKRVVGIDPAGRKHQAAIVDEKGIQQGKSFMVPVSYEGYEVKLGKEPTKALGSCGPENLVFAIETSCTPGEDAYRLSHGQGIYPPSRQPVKHLPLPTSHKP